MTLTARIFARLWRRPQLHIHVSHGGATLILHPAKQESDVRPYSGTADGNYFDVFCYRDRKGLQQLVEMFQTSGVEIVNGPNWDEHWSEVTIRDLDGYCIAFGVKPIAGDTASETSNGCHSAYLHKNSSF